MDSAQLQQGIAAKFGSDTDQGCRLLFWYDPEQSFKEVVAELDLPDVTVLDMTGRSIFETKKRIELDEPHTRFLLYFPYAEPAPDNDWFLDVRLYSEQFFADVSSMLLHELGIVKMSLRAHIRDRQAFLANKQRLAALKRLVTDNEDERSLDRKMLAVIVKADSALLSDILLCLFKDYATGLASDDTSLMDTLARFDLTDALWLSLADALGYDAQEPSLADLALKLFCTELWCQIDAPDRDWLLKNVLKTASGRATALAFMASWRDSRRYAQDYESISQLLAQKLEIVHQCSHYSPHQLIECVCFEAIEQIIIRGLVSDLSTNTKSLDHVSFEALLSRRLLSHWCLSYKKYASIYAAMRQAERLMVLRQRYVDGFHFDSCQALYSAYTRELFQFDQAYRLFNEHVQTLVNQGAEILRQLDETIEKLYTQWYLFELGVAWDRLLATENRLEHWTLPDIQAQYRFYDNTVRPRMLSKQTKRLFVVISDALRYEIADELTTLINGEKRFKAELSSQLGVLPSYTALGMAALLPHKTLEYQAQTGVVMVDGQSSAGLENRNTLLGKVNGLAVSAKVLMGWSNQEGRDFIRDYPVIYIYHDTIDAICDKQTGEDRTPLICRTAIDELQDLITRIINRLNGSQVILTADHGFLYQQQALEKPDKTTLPTQPNGAFEAKKRYILGDNLPMDDAYWTGKVANTAAALGETAFMLPKGVQRFHLVGGAQFVHGGAMLQEVCVPIVQIRELQKQQAAKHAKQRVGVVVARMPIKLVNNIDKIRLIQTDPVGEHFVARSLDIYIINSQGEGVSSRETLNFDSHSPVMDERTREACLKLVGANFNRNAAYTLVLEDRETHTRFAEYAVTIDLAFQDDFF